jgi:hypothetical protein
LRRNLGESAGFFGERLLRAGSSVVEGLFEARVDRSGEMLENVRDARGRPLK